MTNRKDGGAAFPHQELNDDGTHFHTHMGLTKRDWFAGMALQGILANRNYDAPRKLRLDGMAKDAYSAADAMLAERAKAGSDE